MSVSKKVRHKEAKTASRRRPARPPLPDRRAMEDFSAALGGRRDDAATAQAQDLIYDAWEEANSRARITLARKALSISPLCADAFSLLAEEAKSAANSQDLYARALEAAELALGPAAFQEYVGHFWGFLETRPYMRAKAGLAITLRQLGDDEAAIRHYREMLKLNPNDNQGIRHALAACLLQRGEEAALKELLAAYPDEATMCWLTPAPSWPFAMAVVTMRRLWLWRRAHGRKTRMYRPSWPAPDSPPSPMTTMSRWAVLTRRASILPSSVWLGIAHLARWHG